MILIIAIELGLLALLMWLVLEALKIQEINLTNLIHRMEKVKTKNKKAKK